MNDTKTNLSPKLVIATFLQMPPGSCDAYAVAAVHRKVMRYFLRFYVKDDWEKTYAKVVDHVEAEGLISRSEAESFRKVDVLLQRVNARREDCGELDNKDIREAIAILDELIDAVDVGHTALGAALIGRDNLLSGPPTGQREGRPHFKWWHADIASFLLAGDEVVGAIIGGGVSAIAAL